MGDKYVLNDKREAVPTDDVLAWARMFEDGEARRVARTQVGPLSISTVFLGLDHAFGEGPPMLFETMVFGLPDGGEDMDRCSTWAQAEAMHAAFVKRYQPVSAP